MEYIREANSIKVTDSKISLLKHVAIFLYAVVSSALLAVVGHIILDPKIQAVYFITNFWMPLLFGVFAVLPIIFFSGRRTLTMKKRILIFIGVCTTSQWMAFIAGVLSLILFTILTFVFAMIGIIGSTAVATKIALVSALLIPSAVGAGAILLFQQILFSEVVSMKKSALIPVVVYCFLFPILLSFFMDVSTFLGALKFSGDEGVVDAQTYLKVSFFWQVGVFYFLTKYFSHLANSYPTVVR